MPASPIGEVVEAVHHEDVTGEGVVGQGFGHQGCEIGRSRSIVLTRHRLVEGVVTGSLGGIGDAPHQGVDAHTRTERQVWPAGDVLTHQACSISQRFPMPDGPAMTMGPPSSLSHA